MDWDCTDKRNISDYFKVPANPDLSQYGPVTGLGLANSSQASNTAQYSMGWETDSAVYRPRRDHHQFITVKNHGASTHAGMQPG